MVTSTYRRCPHGHDGDATVQRRPDGLRWMQADEKVLIADEVLDYTDTGFLFAKYELGNWCDEAHAWHATLRANDTGVTPTAPDAAQGNLAAPSGTSDGDDT